ncbi:MAG: hypothetical protein J1F03_01855 [Oscillospiraceae bacterium]|nr:hypothetical protein [Oscillospiraceae bacterium]
MDNIEDLLRALVDDDDDGCEEKNCGYYEKRCEEQDCDRCGEDGDRSEGLFSGLDPEMLIKLMGLVEVLNKPDDTERFLLTLKPLLRAENRNKVDSAMRLLKLFSLLPILKEAGIFDNLI